MTSSHSSRFSNPASKSKEDNFTLPPRELLPSPSHDAIAKSKINSLILHYFIQEGYQNAASSFSKETGINVDSEPATRFLALPGALDFVTAANLSPVDFVDAVKKYSEQKSQNSSPSHSRPEFGSNMVKGYSSIDKRRKIKYLILKGDITQAIHVISTYFPTVLDCNNLLLFKLLRLSLIEMIRDHKFKTENLKKPDAEAEKQFLDDVLLFVRENLISKVTHSHELLKELEMTMSLLCFNFSPDKPTDGQDDLPEELRQLFDLSLRNECYRVVNRVILDLENTDLDIQQYKGLTYANFGASMLLKLPTAPPYFDQEDVEMTDADVKSEPDALSYLDQVTVPVASEDPQLAPIQPVQESLTEQASLESQLEKIALLWIATEQRLVEKEVISAKRYGLDSRGSSLQFL